MKCGSLFSGIGGLDLGLERAGMEVVWQVEIDEWCRRVLAKHWPDVKRYGDVKDLTGDELEAVDLICGGFPCQPVSAAGQRRGADDPRWLWPEMARLVREVRPRFVLVENVPGLFHRGFGDVVGDLVASGYDTEWESLPAAAFGAPHLRDRVFILAHPAGDLRRASGDDRPQTPDRGGAVAHADGSGRQRRPRFLGASGRPQPTDRSQWAVEPDVGRVAHGVPSRVDRLRGLGNAVVPQVAEWIGRRIMGCRE